MSGMSYFSYEFISYTNISCLIYHKLEQYYEYALKKTDLIMFLSQICRNSHSCRFVFISLFSVWQIGTYALTKFI